MEKELSTEEFRAKKKQQRALFAQLQALPYEVKIRKAEQRAYEFMEETEKMGLNQHVSVGGLDSITLFLFLRKIGINVPAISVSSLEDKSIQIIHKALGVISVHGNKNKVEILNEYGFPVISKRISGNIEKIQNPTEKNKTVRHAIITGECGEVGHFAKNSRMKLPKKWLELFGGADQEGAALGYKEAFFKVSNKCCEHLKEKPCRDWAKGHNSVPFLGIMASEGGQREDGIIEHGCNYYGKTVIRSAPFGIFTRNDILRLALDMDTEWKNGWREEAERIAIAEGRLKEGEHYPESIIPDIYGTIERDSNGNLYTTKAQRTGCSMCGYGVHMEKRPHRFDQLRERNYKEWEFYMYRCCTDKLTGEKFGWGKVLDYIGVPWEDIPIDIGNQTDLFGMMEG